MTEEEIAKVKQRADHAQDSFSLTSGDKVILIDPLNMTNRTLTILNVEIKRAYFPGLTVFGQWIDPMKLAIAHVEVLLPDGTTGWMDAKYLTKADSLNN